MAVDNPDVVDAISIETATDKVFLTITDHLDWEDYTLHASTLQAKINTYLSFVESGEMIEVYPNASGRNVVVFVLQKHPLSEAGRAFLERARAVLDGAGIELQYRVKGAAGAP